MLHGLRLFRWLDFALLVRLITQAKGVVVGVDQVC